MTKIKLEDIYWVFCAKSGQLWPFTFSDDKNNYIDLLDNTEHALESSVPYKQFMEVKDSYANKNGINPEYCDIRFMLQMMINNKNKVIESPMFKGLTRRYKINKAIFNGSFFESVRSTISSKEIDIEKIGQLRDVFVDEKHQEIDMENEM